MMSNFGEGGIVEPNVDKDVPVLLTPDEMDIFPNRMIEIESKSKDKYDSLEVFSGVNGVYICHDSAHGHNESSAVAIDREDLKCLIDALKNVLKD